MDHFSRSVALEEALKPNGAKICALAPGVIDTDMQTQMRTTDSHDFPGVDRFIELHAKQQLQTPEAAAAAVLQFLHRADFGANPIGDVRD